MDSKEELTKILSDILGMKRGLYVGDWGEGSWKVASAVLVPFQFAEKAEILAREMEQINRQNGRFLPQIDVLETPPASVTLSISFGREERTQREAIAFFEDNIANLKAAVNPIDLVKREDGTWEREQTGFVHRIKKSLENPAGRKK